MTRKRILDITSIKKHDNMLPIVGNPDGSYTPGPLVIGTGATVFFCPTARGASSTDYGESHRQRQTCFMRGYKENLAITISGGGVWKWRRLCFTMKGQRLFATAGSTIPWYDAGGLVGPDVSVGSMRRAMTNPSTTQYINMRDYLWDGQEGSDWSNEFTAKPDTTRITVKSDRTRTLNPANDVGRAYNFKLWYPMNKNLVYGDDEDQSQINTFYVSTESKAGMGDYYIYDIIQNLVPSPSGTTALRFDPEGIMYWHEK